LCSTMAPPPPPPRRIPGLLYPLFSFPLYFHFGPSIFPSLQVVYARWSRSLDQGHVPFPWGNHHGGPPAAGHGHIRSGTPRNVLPGMLGHGPPSFMFFFFFFCCFLSLVFLIYIEPRAASRRAGESWNSFPSRARQKSPRGVGAAIQNALDPVLLALEWAKTCLTSTASDMRARAGWQRRHASAVSTRHGARRTAPALRRSRKA